MATKKVYICFEYEPDVTLKALLVGQSRNEGCPFEVIDKSLKEAAPEKDWEEKARDRIKTADQVIVLVGHSTYRASGVLKEIAIARSLGKKITQLIGYKDRKCKRVPGAGILYRWTWDNLKKILD